MFRSSCEPAGCPLASLWMGCFQQGLFLPPWWNSIKINNNNNILPPKSSICVDSLNLNSCCADSAAMPLSLVSIVFLDRNTVGPIVYPGQPKGKISSSLQNCWLCSIFPFCDPSLHERAILSLLGFILPPRSLCETNSFVLMSLWFSWLCFFSLIKTCLGTDICGLIWRASQ